MLIHKNTFKHLNFKLIDTGLHDATWNIAMDQALLEKSHIYGPFLRFLSFSPECVLIGYFQSVNQEIRIDYCEKEKIQVQRRITGGGAIYFDPSQIGWEIIGRISDFPYTHKELSYIFGSAVAYALSKMGINAEFRERNDIEVNGKKISGMGGVTYEGNFLFQGTLLVKDRIERMLKSLKVPIEKLKPKEIDSLRERVTCIEHELGYVPKRDELKEILISGISEYLGVNITPYSIPPDIKKRHKELLPYFKSEKWVNKIVFREDEQDVLSGYYRTQNGTIKVSMMINTRQKMIRNAIFTGDFFLNPRESIYDIESLLRNTRFDLKNVEDIVIDYFKRYKLDGITATDLILAIKEVFKKWTLIKDGLTPKEANNVFMVNLNSLKGFEPKAFLLPYCAKETSCSLRYKKECVSCGLCTVGDAYNFSYEYGLRPITITTFEDLMETFEDLKREGIYEYIGSCCEAFYIKHQDDFNQSGLSGVLINIENATCYDLDKAKEAYIGKFESKTNLNLSLIKKVLKLIFKKETKGARK